MTKRIRKGIQNPWYVIAQIFATLAGMIIVAASMFLAWSASLSSQLSPATEVMNLSAYGGMTAAEETAYRRVLQDIKQEVTVNKTIAIILYIVSIVLALLSVFLWSRGYEYDHGITPWAQWKRHN